MKRNMKWIGAVLCLAVFAAMAMALGRGQSDSDETKQAVSSEGSEKVDTDENTSNASDVSKASSGAAVTIDD